ncbi:MAG: RNA pseudouridine synthase [Saprospiraceae bacterium]|nr:RNA pseudouridine synthase [Saprospiraceae bacterium]
MPDLNIFTHFSRDISSISLPNRFNYPFSYQPHPLAVAAAEELMENLDQLKDHYFGLNGSNEGLGKMFGVLVVKDLSGNLGYLSAFSGKLSGGHHYDGFVPPVFDTMDEKGFYRIGEEAINKVNRTISILESEEMYINLISSLNQITQKAEVELSTMKSDFNTSKKERHLLRQHLSESKGDNTSMTLENLEHESIRQHYLMKDRKKYWRKSIAELTGKIAPFEDKISLLKEKRKAMSAALQQKLFDAYSFSNIEGCSKNLFQIFEITEDITPPSGAGECAAPKLLQHAFLYGYKPVTMAEFWWGKSPSSEIRKHKHFYPACNSKCKPILGHMLQGMDIDPNPMLAEKDLYPEFDILYEDQHLLAINKPPDFLSVPGKQDLESIYSLVKRKYPNATGPLMVHRLDMSTSGILLIAKSTEVYQNLQQQFITRKISKRYIAVLDGTLTDDSGSIDLPLRVDLDDRPRQLVCYDFGKPATTKWKVISRDHETTRIYFYPLTGRTHQLRIHAAHHMGLNMPIKGDDLYGKREKRLYLHADQLTFIHPVTKKEITVNCPAEF